MKQFSFKLLTILCNFKKSFLGLGLLLFLILHININATAQCIPPVVIVTPAISCGGAVINGPCVPLTASGADIYTWSPFAGLYTNCTHTIPYTGQNTTTVYAAPLAFTTYTVTGTIVATGCTNTARAFINYTPPAPVVTPASVNMCLGDPAVKLKVTSGLQTAQFCSGPVNIPVPDNNLAGVSNSVIVSGIPACSNITSMSVTINMPHSRVGDMVFVLKSPSGAVINLDALLNSTNNAGANFVNTVISGAGTAALSSGTAPFTNTFRADAVGGSFTYLGLPYPGGPVGFIPTTQLWTSLYSVPNGVWTLAMYDALSSNIGTLTSWCLNITYACGTGIPTTPAIWTPMAGLYTDPAATVPYTGNGIDSVWTRPVLAGVYTYQVTVQGLPLPAISFTNTAAIAIPVGGTGSPYPSNVAVSGLPATGVSVKFVELNGINHTSSEDIDIILQSPTSQNVILMSDVGATTAIPGNTFSFSDSGPAMSITGTNPTGTYKPTNNGTPDNFPAPGPGALTQFSPALAMFGNIANVNGLWKLFVFDDDGTGNQGTIAGGFTIIFDTGIPGCTSPPRNVVVTVSQPASITVQPVNQTICTDNAATFTVGVAGTGPFTYQWQVSSNSGNTYNNIANGGVYSGVTTNALTVTAPPMSMSGYLYRVIVNGGSGCSGATSASALLTVNPLPVIVITANPLLIGPGQTTTIFSTVTPNPAAIYTWYYNAVVLSGATADTLLVNYGSAGDYQLKVTNVNGCTNLSNIINIANSFAFNLITYPNPSAGKFQVRYNSPANNTVQRSLIVYNNRGERIITKNFIQTIPYQKIDVDIRAHGKGLYWVEMKDQNGKRLAINRVVIQ